jgi:hypothetical protein
MIVSHCGSPKAWLFAGAVCLLGVSARAQEGIPPDLVEIRREVTGRFCGEVSIYVNGERRTTEFKRAARGVAIKCEDRQQELEAVLLEAKTKNKYVVFSPGGTFSSPNFKVVDPPKDGPTPAIYRSLIAKLRRVEADLANCKDSRGTNTVAEPVKEEGHETQ